VNIRTRAPSRIDLAGGTLDIWPLYLLIDDAATVNVAIDLYAETSLQSARDTFQVRDPGRGIEAESSSTSELEKIPGAEIAGTLLRFFDFVEPVVLETRTLAPPQSGLGASSALGIAIAGALNAATGTRYGRLELIEVVKDVEARILGVPTGTQDHYPPVFGGACCLWWGLGAVRREPLHLDPEIFEGRFLLAYTHQPHRSGMNNWEVVKRFLDGDPTTREALRRIGRIAADMRDALKQRNMEQVEILIMEEWTSRRQLAPGVYSPEMQGILEAAIGAGATAGKACGAGGGGCLLIAARPETRKRVEEAIGDAGGSLVEYHVATQGLQVERVPGGTR
jgi:D-glycero-alpha-D-manno-heptose-7-phosphate kinase